MEEKEFTGTSAEMRNADEPFLSWEEIKSLQDSNKYANMIDERGDVSLTIKACYAPETVTLQGKEQKGKFLLAFQELSKMLVLNVTNRRAIVLSLGSSNIPDWKGKRVGLYVELHCQKPMGKRGETVPGIRIRNTSLEPVDGFATKE